MPIPNPIATNTPNITVANIDIISNHRKCRPI